MGRAKLEPTGSLTAHVELPVYPMETRCRVCQIYHRDPEAYLTMSEMLLQGRPRTDTIAYLASRGITVSQSVLSHHHRAHLLPHVKDIVQMQQRLRIEIETLADLDDIDLGRVIARQLGSQAMLALQRINLPQLLAAVVDPGDTIELVDKLTKLMKALGEITQNSADAALKGRMIELRELEILAKAGNLDAVAIRYIQSRLKADPRKAQDVINILGLTPKALPADAHASKEPTTRPRRDRRTR